MRIALLGLLMSCLAPAANGMYVQHDLEKVPVARVLENLDRKLKSKPDDYDLRYQSARVHAMAACPDVDVVMVIRSEGNATWNGRIQFGEPGSDNGTPEGWRERRSAEKTPRKFDAEHLHEAIGQYELAMSLMKKAKDPDQVKWLIKPVQLGHAWCLEKAGRREDAIEAYRQTLAIAWHQEVTHDFDPADWVKGVKYDVRELKEQAADPSLPASLRGHRDVGICFSEEAIRYLIALLDPMKDALEISVLNHRKTTLDRMGRAITPILIPLSDAPFEALIDPAAQVAFDLDGSGVRRPWQWISPKAAWLVFDGKQTGQITSGLQLFGNVTFWVFWRDGYQALGSLDANGDGALDGDELSGLALWVDANGNGVSEPGEVRPLSAYGIDRLSCQGQPLKTGLRWSQQGVRFKDGSFRASYDWEVPTGAPAAAK